MSVEQTLLAGLASALTVAGSVAKLTDGPRGLLNSLGWDLPPGVDDIGLAAADLDRLGGRLTTWAALAADAEASVDDQAEALAELALAVGEALVDLGDLRLVAPQDYLDRTGIVDDFLTRLFDLYLIQSVAVASRAQFDVAVLLGLFEVTRMPADPARFQVDHLRHVVRWDRAASLFSDPGGLLREVYGWGTANFDADALVTRLGAVMAHLSTDVRRRQLPAVPLARIHGAVPAPHPPQTQLFCTLLGGSGPLAGEAGLTLFGLPPTVAGGLDAGLGIAPYAEGTASLRIPLSSRLSVGLAAGADLGSGVALVLRPGADPALHTGLNEVEAGTGAPGAQVQVDLTLAARPGTAITLLDAAGATVEATAVGLALTVLVDGDGTDAALRLQLDGGRVTLSPGGLPFLDAVLPAGGLSAEADFDLSWSHRQGLRFDGRAELATNRAISRRIGPLTIDVLRVALAAGDAVALTATISATLDLGPVSIAVEGLGVRAAVTPGRGNLGSADLAIRATPPSGLGLAIDAKVASGGGHLFADPDGHTYAGVFDLKLGAIGVKALGVLDTRSAGEPGWSLLLLLFAEFDEPVPIGFGFSLAGVGGIVGLNFGVATDELRAAMGTTAFDDVLFPADPVAGAPRIIGRLRTFFPAVPGALVAGPAAVITWGGTVPLLTARLAVLVQLANATGAGPARFDRLVVLGTIRAVAPPGDLPVPPTVQLTADLLGSYDAQSGLLAIDAQLRDSTIAGVAVGGTVIVRVGLGREPALALSAGGFHPDFTDLPPQLPARIDRLSLTWKAGTNASIEMQLQLYVALTAATLQLGASFQIVAKIGRVTLEGGLGFDLLINEDRSFSAHVVGRVRVRYRGHTLAGIGLDMVLSRSADHVWRARGTATFEILWWDVDVDFDDSWGQAARLPATSIEVAAAVRAALTDPANWQPSLPAGGEPLVSLAAPQPPTGQPPPAVLAHPLGQLRIAQQVAPLDLELDHVDDARIEGARSVSITTVRVGDRTGARHTAQDPFTRARYQHLSEAQRLGSRAFESLPSGVVVGDDGFFAPAGIGVGAGHETRLIGPAGIPPPPPRPPHSLPEVWLDWQLGLAAAAGSPLRTRDALRPATTTSLGVQPPALVAVHPGTLLAEPMDPAAARSLPLAEQRAAAAGLRVLEAYEAQP